MSNDAVKSGWVTKCGKSVKSWKRRWFVLKHNGYLYYYENDSLKCEKGKIDVVDAEKIAPWVEISTVEKIPRGFSSSNAFAIVTRERTYTCVCEQDGDNLSWINSLNKVRGAATSDQQYPEPTNPKEQPPQELPKSPPPASQEVTPMSPPPAYIPTAAAPNPPPNQAPPPYNQVPPATQMLSPHPPAQRVSTLPTAAPPPAGPGYTQNHLVGNYQCPQRPVSMPPQPQGYAPPYQPQPPQPAPYPPRSPQPAYQQQYRPPQPAPYQPRPPQPGYQPQYRPPQPVPYQPRPPQPAYPGYQPRPPQPAYPGYQPRPPPPAPYQSQPYYPPQYYQRPPPPQRVVNQSTNVTVVQVGAQQQNVVHVATRQRHVYRS